MYFQNHSGFFLLNLKIALKNKSRVRRTKIFDSSLRIRTSKWILVYRFHKKPLIPKISMNIGVYFKKRIRAQRINPLAQWKKACFRQYANFEKFREKLIFDKVFFVRLPWDLNYKRSPDCQLCVEPSIKSVASKKLEIWSFEGGTAKT